MSIFELADEDLYKQICENPDCMEISSRVPVGKDGEKVFKYVYADDPKYMLGQGSFGQVYVCFYYEGTHQEATKIVKLALKIINIPSSEQHIKKIEHIVMTSRQQIKALIKLRQNKHIIRIEDIAINQNIIYMILEYCNDRDLVYFFTQLKKQRKLSDESYVRAYFAQILDAFQELNKHSFMHRDIKPSNILVKNGVLKVADFGLARQIVEGEKDEFEEHVGTMITAAPQIVLKKQYSSSCDIYSLGVILYWMIYDKYPFEKPPSEEDFISGGKVQYPKNNGIFDVSPEMVRLIKEMLAFKQQERIDWVSLFEHSLFDQKGFPDIQENSYSLKKQRQTYGRNIATQFSDDEQFLDTKIPPSYYKFLQEIEGEQKFNKCVIEERHSLKENPNLYAHKMIKDQYKNQQIRFKFYRSLLHELDVLDVEHIFKGNKQEVIFMKNLLSYSVQKYLIYLMTKVKDQLVSIALPSIFKVEHLKLAEEQPLHQNFVETVIEKVKGLEFTAKVSSSEVGKLSYKCEEYKLDDLMGIFQQINDSNAQNFLVLVDQCIIEMVYFLKPVILRSLLSSSSKIHNDGNFRNLVLLAHYLFMFSMQEEVFPRAYTSEFPYHTFSEQEQFKTQKSFRQLTMKVKLMLERFE